MPMRTIATSTFWQLLSQVVMALLSAVTVKFVAIGLSEELAGNYHSAYGYLQIFGILADFGLYAVAIREVSRTQDQRKVLGGLLILRSIITICSLGVALLVVWIIPQWQGTPLPLSISIAAFVPFFTLLAGILRTIFQVTHAMQYVFLAETLQRIVTVLLMGALILSGIRSSTNVATLYLFLLFGGIGALVLLSLSLLFAGKLGQLRFSVDSQVLWRLLHAAIPYGLAYLCITVYRQLDVTLIALLREDYAIQNASYGFALRIVEMAFLIPTYLLNSVLPSLKREGKEERALLGKTCFCLLLYGISITLLCALWARPLMQLLTEERYLAEGNLPGTDTALMLLSPSILLNALVLYCFYVLLAVDAWRVLLVSLSLGALLSFFMNMWLIPPMGFVGAGLTSVVTHLILAVLLLPQSMKRFPIGFPKHSLVHLGGFALCTAIPLLLLRPLLISESFTLLGLLLLGAVLAGYVLTSGLTRILFEAEPRGNH